MRRAATYAAGAGTVAAAAGGLAWSVGFGPGGASGGYGWLGWGVMAVAGVGSGAWLAGVFGRAGPSFLVALLAGILCRLTATVVGAVAAAGAGREALLAFLAGLAAGFVPLQVYEIVFFFLVGRHAARTGSGRE